MKAASLIATVAAGTLLVIAIGCGKKDEPGQTGAGQQQPTSQAEQAAAQTEAAAEAKAQEILNKAWDLVGQGRHREAQEVLRGLSGMKLTPAQQRGVNALSSAIQAELSKQPAR